MTTATALLSLDQLAQKIEGLRQRNVSTTLGGLQFSATNNGVSISQHDLDFSGVYSRTLNVLGLPSGAMTEYKDDPELLQRMLRSSQSRRSGEAVCLSILGDRVVSIEPGSGSGLDFGDLLPIVQRLPQLAGVQGADVDDAGHLALRLVAQHSATPARAVGDVSHSGVLVELNGAVKASPYVYRMVCTNGMHRETMGTSVSAGSHLTREAMMAAAQVVVQQAYDVARQLLQDFVLSDEHAVTNPTAYLTHMLHDLRIPARHQVALLARVPSMERPTVYGLVNLLTSYAQEHENPRTRHRFEQIGSTVLGLAQANAQAPRCSQCESLLPH